MKWNSTPVIALVAMLIFAAAAGLLVWAGGDDNNAATDPGPTPAQNTPNQNTPEPPGDFGDPPRLGDNVEAVDPSHGQSVSQASTVPLPGGTQEAGACATVNFDNFGDSLETFRWFHMAFDGELVTQRTTLFGIDIDPETDDPTGAIICYMPDEGLPVGRHTAAVSVSDPNVPAAPARQLVGWAFEVVP